MILVDLINLEHTHTHTHSKAGDFHVSIVRYQIILHDLSFVLQRVDLKSLDGFVPRNIKSTLGSDVVLTFCCFSVFLLTDEVDLTQTFVTFQGCGLS